LDTFLRVLPDAGVQAGIVEGSEAVDDTLGVSSNHAVATVLQKGMSWDVSGRCLEGCSCFVNGWMDFFFQVQVVVGSIQDNDIGVLQHHAAQHATDFSPPLRTLVF